MAWGRGHFNSSRQVAWGRGHTTSSRELAWGKGQASSREPASLGCRLPRKWSSATGGARSCSGEFPLLGCFALSCSFCLLQLCHQAQALFLRLCSGSRCRLLCHLLGNVAVFLLNGLKPRLLAFMEMAESLQPVDSITQALVHFNSPGGLVAAAPPRLQAPSSICGTWPGKKVESCHNLEHILATLNP